MRLILAVGLLTLASLAGVAPPAEAGGGSVCVSRVCTVTSGTEFNDALAELEGSSSPGRIQLASTVTLNGANSDPTYAGPGPLTIAGAGPLTLSGFAVSNIITDTSGALLTFESIIVRLGSSEDGSGVVSATGSVRVVDSTFVSNLSNNDTSVEGGAIHSDGDVTVENSTFDGNISQSPNGTALGGAIDALGSVTVTDSTFTNNQAVSTNGSAEGGAIRAGVGVSTTGSTLEGNVAQGGTIALGGAVTSGDGTTIASSNFEENRVESASGAATGGALHSTSLIDIDRSIFLLNEASGSSGQGGAIYVDDPGTDRIDDVLFRENRARSDIGAAEGGALYIAGGGLSLVEDTIVRDNSAVSDSGSTSGGGIYLRDETLRMIDGAVVRNYADQTTGNGGGIRAEGGEVTLADITLAENIGPNGSAIYSNEKVTTRFATVAANRATAGVGQLVTTDNFTASATVVADANPSGVDTTDCVVSGSISTGSGNVESGTSCEFDGSTGQQMVPSALLGPVRDNGGSQAGPAEIAVGPTTRLSMFPLPGSPLIDTMTPGQCNSAMSSIIGLDDDARDVPRPHGEGCDTGAIEAIFPAHAFTDVSPFYDPTVRWVTNDSNVPQILSGFPNGTFGQTLNITRGQAARLYYNGAGAPAVSGLPAHGFTDSTPFFENAIRWAKDQGLFLGFPDNTFRPNNPINRGNYTRSLYNFAGAQNVNGLPAHPFTDVTPFYEDAVKWAKARGLANGYPDNTYRQNNNINRGNAARTFYNLAQTRPAWALSDSSIPANMIIKTNIDVF